MSRSCRKVACLTGGQKEDKRNASKAVRNFSNYIQDGKSFKKIFCSWNIRDYRPCSWDVNDDWHESLKRK